MRRVKCQRDPMHVVCMWVFFKILPPRELVLWTNCSGISLQRRRCQIHELEDEDDFHSFPSSSSVSGREHEVSSANRFPWRRIRACCDFQNFGTVGPGFLLEWCVLFPCQLRGKSIPSLSGFQLQQSVPSAHKMVGKKFRTRPLSMILPCASYIFWVSQVWVAAL